MRNRIYNELEPQISEMRDALVRLSDVYAVSEQFDSNVKLAGWVFSVSSVALAVSASSEKLVSSSANDELDRLSRQVGELREALVMSQAAFSAIRDDVFQSGRVSGRSQTLGYSAMQSIAAVLASTEPASLEKLTTLPTTGPVARQGAEENS